MREVLDAGDAEFGWLTALFGAGLAAAALGAVTWPVIGRLEPARVVLLCSGLLVVASAAAVRERRRAA